MTEPVIARRPVTVAAATALAVAAADAVTKTWAAAHPRPRGLVHLVHNPAYSLGAVDGSVVVLVAVSLVVLGATAVWLWPRMLRGAVPAWSVGALLGGAGANALDRAVNGQVTDFLLLPHVAVINIADVAVVAALVALVVRVWPTRRRLVSSTRSTPVICPRPEPLDVRR